MSQQLTWTCPKGHLGGDPEFSTIKGGKLMAKFSIAHNRYKYNKETEEYEEIGITSWLGCTAFGYAAELIEAMELEKGDAVYATGTMYKTEWEDEEGYMVEGWDFLVNQLFAIPSVFEEDEEEEEERPRRRSRSRKRKSNSSRSKKSSGKKRKSRLKGRKSKSRSKKSSSNGTADAKDIVARMRGK